MDFQKLADHLRTSTAALSVRDIIIVTDNGDFSGHGKISKGAAEIELEIILHDERELPAIGGRTYTRDEFWKIGGVIEGHVPFWAVGLPHENKYHSSEFSTARSARFGFDTLHHLTSPFRDGEMRDAVLAVAKSDGAIAPAAAGGSAFARLANYKLVWCDIYTVTTEENEFLGKTTRTLRDTLRGSFGEFEYGLIQRGEDCEIHLRKKSDAGGSTHSMREVNLALLQALAFLHGRHAWPQWQRIENGSGPADEYATAPRSVPRTIHTVLSERTCASSSDPALLIRKAVECFLLNDEFSESLNSYLFLAREAAAAETPDQVGTLGLCAVFEGFVGFLHSHFCVPGESSDDASFDAVRSELARYASERAASAGVESGAAASWKRFVGRIQSATALRPADKFRKLAEHFRLPWEKMSPALDAWKKCRNPLSHGKAQSGEVAEDMIVPSRIAGAINVLAAAAIGYSGLAVLSRIEDQFVRLPEPLA